MGCWVVEEEGAGVSNFVGLNEGKVLGFVDGGWVVATGETDGLVDGLAVGEVLGFDDGCSVGLEEGEVLGFAVGLINGDALGFVDG